MFASPKFDELIAAVEKIADAAHTIARLDDIQAAAHSFAEIAGGAAAKILTAAGTPDDKVAASPLVQGDRILESMRAAGKRKAAEIGREVRAKTLCDAVATLESFRAILPQLAAAASIEIGALAREARDRG